jgi:Tol biopolymer transport system component
MTPEQVRGKTAKALFLAAVQMPPEQREDFLRPTAERDPELAAEVRELLRFDEGEDELLDGSILNALELEPEPAPAPVLPQGTLLAGRYRVDGPLGSGASSNVYLGRDELLMGKNVAIKLLRSPAGGSLFIREMEALARINHPGIMQILDLGETEDRNSFLVTEYAPGRTLRSVLLLQALPHDRVARLVRQIGQALSSAHAQGVWHLDLKPENILVVDFGAPEERIRIIDFGLAGLADAPGRPVPGGSPAYMAPEQVTGRGGALADQYSLGAVAVEMLTGQPPGLQRSIHKLFETHSPAVPAAAVTALARGLSPNPDARFGSVGEFLSAFLDGMTAPRRKQVSWRHVGAIAVAGVALGFAGAVFWRGANPGGGDFVPLLRISGSVLDPSISPDGETIFYALEETGSGDIYSYRSGVAPVRLTRHDSPEHHPVCSNDGRQLAFLRNIGQSVRSLLLMPVEGGPATAIAEGTFQDIAWTPDNRTVVVSQVDEDGVRVKLTAIDTRTREWRDLTTPGQAERDLAPAVSRDGSAIAFVRRRGYDTVGVYVLDLAPGVKPAGSPRLVVAANARTRVQWSPDGRELIYSVGPPSRQSLWRVSAAGEQPRELLAAGRFAVNPMVPAARNAVAFVHSVLDSNLVSISLDTPGGKLAGRSELYVSSAREELPSFIPGGQSICFLTRRSERRSPIRIGSLDGSESGVVAMPGNAESFTHLAWFDSRRYVLTMISKEKKVAAFLGGIDRDWEQVEDVDGPVSWASPDGNTLLFTSERSGRGELWMKSGNRPSFPLTRLGGAQLGLPTPDRSTIYFMRDPDSIYHVPFHGGEESLLLRGVSDARNFAVGRTGVYYISIQRPPRIRLRRFDDGRDVELYRLERRASRGIAVSEDERTIVFSQFEPMATDISMVDNLR